MYGSAARTKELLQARALREGIPWQTLMASVLHESVHGTLGAR